ncbi:YesL family protein [Caldifermentibacillus hisashii]|uniref:YesL family protein n=1 Tax=Caldifermentibacillus hisashii TaxID=996558 RepID=UPI0034D7AEC3
MSIQNFVNSLDRIFTWITRLVVINILWFFFAIIGLIVAGIFPATLSVMRIFRKWIFYDKDFSIWSTFKQEYRKEFIKSNLIGWILTIIGIILFINYLLLKSMSNISIVFPVAFYILILFYINIVIWSFPQLAHYNGSISQYFKNAIILGFGGFHYTIAIVIYMFSILYISLKFPGILPFFTISIGAFGWVWISINLFQKISIKKH